MSQSLLPVSQGFHIKQYLQTVIMLSSYTKQTLYKLNKPKTNLKNRDQRLKDVQLKREAREMFSETTVIKRSYCNTARLQHTACCIF